MRSGSLSLAAALIFLAVQAAQADDPVTIGIVTDLSGPASYFGQQTRVGAELAERELNAAGTKVHFIVEDSALNTSKAVSAAQKLLFVDKVDALYSNFTPVSVAVSSVAQANKKLLVYTAAAESPARGNPYAFKSYSDYGAGCAAIADTLRARGVQRLGVLVAEAEYGELCLAGIKRVFPTPLEQSYKQGEDVSTQMLALKSKGAQAVVNGAFEGDVMNTLQAAAKLEYHVPIGAAEDALTPKLRERFAAILEGSLTFGRIDFPAEFAAAAARIPGGDKLSALDGAGFAYVHLKQMAAAIRACSDQRVECYVDRINAAGPDPIVGFLGWKDRIAKLQTSVKTFTNGALVVTRTYVTGEPAA